MSFCLECRNGDHVPCIDRDDTRCGCTCAAYTDCDTCHGLVILWADDEDDSSFAHGECCTWGYVETFEGAIRLDLDPMHDARPKIEQGRAATSADDEGDRLRGPSELSHPTMDRAPLLSPDDASRPGEGEQVAPHDEGRR